MEHRSAAEATRAARARYELDVRRGAERLHQGEFVAIDVDSGLVTRIAPWRICARQAACRGVRVGSNGKAAAVHGRLPHTPDVRPPAQLTTATALVASRALGRA